MGLSVSYRWSVAQDTDPFAFLARLQAFAQARGLAVTSPVLHFLGSQCQIGEEPKSDERSLMARITATRREEVADQDEPLEEVPEEIWCFWVAPGDGAEEACLGLRRLASQARLDWSSFCKTQYACRHEYGGETNFVRVHSRLISLLRDVENAGANVEVHDDGELWETGKTRHLRNKLAEFNAVDLLLG